MKRKTGYYWIRKRDDNYFQIGWFIDFVNYWQLVGDERKYEDNHFDKIISEPINISFNGK